MIAERSTTNNDINSDLRPIKMLGEIFDPKSELLVHDRIRPHWWAQSGAIVFVTFRTIDSIPKEVIQRWDREKNAWLHARGLLNRRHWSEVIGALNEKQRVAFNRNLTGREKTSWNLSRSLFVEAA